MLLKRQEEQECRALTGLHLPLAQNGFRRFDMNCQRKGPLDCGGSD